MFEPHFHDIPDDTEENEGGLEAQADDGASTGMASSNSSRPTIHWDPVIEGDLNGKEEINTDTDHFDALFARSNAAPPHPRCYSSCSPATAPPLLAPDPSTHLYAKSQPLLLSSPSAKQKHANETPVNSNPRKSISSSPPRTQPSNPASAKTKRKNFSLTHTTQTFLQASNNQLEPLAPLARSCSYKRPQSIKKYRQKKEKEKDQPPSSPATQQHPDIPARKYSITGHGYVAHPGASDTSRKSVTAATTRIPVAELMASADDPQDQWPGQHPQRSERLGSLTLDQLQLPPDGDQEIYLVRQFHTTSKGFVNRGDSFKRSIKRSGSNSRRSSSFRVNTNLVGNDRTSSPEHDINHSPTSVKELRTSTHSLTNSPGINLNGILDSHFIETNSPQLPLSLPDRNGNDNEDDDDDNPLVERIQTEDGRVQDVRVYQVYLLGMSGTGKCSLMRQFKTTEYRGIYDYSSSLDDDPDNTVPIMLDGVESRLHVTTIDVDQIKSSVTGDAYIVVYSITDRQSFQTAVQLVKNIRDNESINHQSPIKRPIPIILVGNKSDLVRKRSVTKETARHAASKYNCKFVETSAAINDKVDDLLAGTLKQIRINEQIRTELKRRLTITNGSIDTNDSEAPILTNTSSRKSATIHNRNSKNVFSKFLSVFRKKPSRLSSDVENLNGN